MTTAEQWAEAAARSAQRSEQKAETATNAVLETAATVGRLERELREHRRETKVGFITVREDISKLKQGPYRSADVSASLTLEDFDESPTGTHLRIRKEVAHAKLHEDAKKWRTLWRRVRWLVWAAIGAIAIKSAELGIERLFHVKL